MTQFDATIFQRGAKRWAHRNWTGLWPGSRMVASFLRPLLGVLHRAYQPLVTQRTDDEPFHPPVARDRLGYCAVLYILSFIEASPSAKSYTSMLPLPSF